MAIVSQSIETSWIEYATLLTDLEINTLFEIFGPLPVLAQFTLRSGLIGLGKSRILVANQDQLQPILLQYVNGLTKQQQIIVKGYIQEWIPLATKVERFTEAERVKIRVSSPEETRNLIRKRIQTYIPIFRVDEIEGYSAGIDVPYTSDNEIMRG